MMRRFFISFLVLIASLSAHAQLISNNNALISTDNEIIDPDYQELLTTALTDGETIPVAKTRQLGNQLMKDLKSSNRFSDGVAIYVTATDAAAREFAKYNWIDPSQYFLNETTPNSLTHNTLGFVGDGTNMLLTGFNSSAAGNANFTQNDAGVFSYIATDIASTGLDWGAFDGTRQSKLNSRNASDLRTIHFNDGTNSTVATTYGKGLFVTFRNNGTTKRSWKDGTQTDIAVASTGLPNEQFAILGRRSSGANDFPSTRTISYWDAGQAPSSANITEFRNTFAQYYINLQDPVFTVTDIPFAPTELVALGTGGDFDTEALICGPVYHNNSILLYGGSTQVSPGNVREYSIGAFDLTNFYTGSKDAANPIIARGDVGLGGADEGLTAQDVWPDGAGTYYLATTVYNSDGSLDVALMTSTTADPKTFSNFTRVLTSDYGNHAARFFEDPAEPTYLYMTYSYKETSGDPFRINVARCLKSNLLTTWTVVDTDIIASTPGAGVVAQEYAKLWLDGSTWYCTYGRFYGFFGTANFSMWSTSSSDRTSFSEGFETMTPSGVSGQFDENYRAHYQATTYPIPSTNIPFYFGGREGFGNNNYIGIGVKYIRLSE